MEPNDTGTADTHEPTNDTDIDAGVDTDTEVAGRCRRGPSITPWPAAVLMGVLATVWAMLWTLAPAWESDATTAIPAGISVGGCVLAAMLATRAWARGEELSDRVAIGLVVLAVISMFVSVALYATLTATLTATTAPLGF